VEEGEVIRGAQKNNCVTPATDLPARAKPTALAQIKDEPRGEHAMPRQHLTGHDQYLPMSCHVFALSGNPALADNVNTRYAALGDLLLHPQQVPNNNNVAHGLNVVTNRQILDAVAEMPDGDQQGAVLRLLCTEFGLVPHAGSGIRLWGHTEPGQMLPEHMYVTYTDNRIYDTMPNAPIRRRVNDQGRNPPSYGDTDAGADVMLAADVVFSIEIAALAAGTQAAVNAPNNQWQNG
jgi:hypothetical protein